jgi:hypothetical protein
LGGRDTGLRDRSKERLVLDVLHSNSDDGFVYSVRQHLPLAPKRCKSDYNLVVVPLSDGIMTSIDRENFSIAMDTEGRLILTRKDRKVQLVFDYEKGFMTGVLGGALFETFDIPKQEETQYHG